MTFLHYSMLERREHGLCSTSNIGGGWRFSKGIFFRYSIILLILLRIELTIICGGEENTYTLARQYIPALSLESESGRVF